ncbi:MAG: hypothetical protein ABI600_02735 [Luteolibacter sp.]
MLVEIHQFEKARLFMGWFFCDGRVMKAMAGAWNFYVPALNLKLAYPRNGKVHCLRPITPPYDLLMSGALDQERIGRYWADDWKRALGKSTRRRAAENFVSASRLHAAGLGPKPLGICYVKNFSYSLFGPSSETAGIMIEDINQLPQKTKATEEEIIAAGVTLDQIRSCVRQQIRGYVSDLNSVVGVMPVDAEEEIQEILNLFSLQVGEGS